MFKFLKSLPEEIALLRAAIERLRDERKPEDLSVRLMRRLLCSIDVEPKETLAETFINQVGPVFKNAIEPRLRRMAREQEHFTTGEAADWYQAIFGRGTLNGIELVREDLQMAYAAWIQKNPQAAESFDTHNTNPE